MATASPPAGSISPTSSARKALTRRWRRPATRWSPTCLARRSISANRFLTGKDCAYVVAWAEKKMTGKAVRYTVAAEPSRTKTVVRTSPEFIAYREAMLKMVEMASGAAL